VIAVSEAHHNAQTFWVVDGARDFSILSTLFPIMGPGEWGVRTPFKYALVFSLAPFRLRM